MVLETAVEPNQDQQLSTAEEDEEAVPASSTTGDIVFDEVHKLVEKFAANRLGQFVIERVDRFLKTVEDTAKWSLPQEKTDSKLERPLPWLLFLMLIIALRQVRMTVSLGALMIGNGPVTPHDMVYFIQTRRRKLRSIRIQGLKVIRQRELEQIALRTGGLESGVMVKLGKLLTIAICRPGYHSEPARRIPVRREQEETQQNQHYVPPPRFTKKRQREDDSVEADLTCDQLLTKYANENSEDDSDYVPNREEETHDETTTSVTHSSSEDTRGEYNMETDKATLNVPSSQEPANASNKSENVEVVSKSGEPQAALSKASESTNEPQPPLPPPAPAATAAQPTPFENGPSNGNENPEADVAQKRLLTPTTGDRKRTLLNGGNHVDGDDGELLRKSTPGHESAARTIPSIPSHFRSVTSARSPGSSANFQPFFSPEPILKNPISSSAQAVGHSTPKSPDEAAASPDSESTSSADKPKTQQHLPHAGKQTHHHNRYRGRNRR